MVKSEFVVKIANEIFEIRQKIYCSASHKNRSITDEEIEYLTNSLNKR